MRAFTPRFSRHAKTPAAAIAELDAAERLVVLSLRRWLAGYSDPESAHWTAVWNQFAVNFGVVDGREALSAFTGLIKALQCHPRRAVYYHQPCCPCLGDDEIDFLDFVAACSNGPPEAARRGAERLVQADGTADMLQAGTRIARIMRRHGMALPNRSGGNGVAERVQMPYGSAPTVH